MNKKNNDLEALIAAQARLSSYFETHSIPHTLEGDDLPFAVISLGDSTDKKTFTELGQALRGWISQTQGVRKILGLDHLLKGELPKVSGELLLLPVFPFDPEKNIINVALVVIDPSAHRESIELSLKEVENQIPIHVYSLEQFSYMYR